MIWTGPWLWHCIRGALFYLTEGRAYSAAEYRMWPGEVGLVTGEIVPTRVHCGVLPAAK